MKQRILLGAVALVSSSVVTASDHPPDGLVVFINASSSSVTVSVDGSTICTMTPGNRCSTILSGDLQSEHRVSAESNGRNWNDRIKAWECHANYAGTKTYTFRDDSVPFTCDD